MNYPRLPLLAVHAIVFMSILVSGSLYYATFGTNLLLVPFAAVLIVFLFFHKRAISKAGLIYTLFLFVTVFINPHWVVSTTMVLVLRSLLALVLISILSFDQFSLIFHQQMKILSAISLLFIPIIFFNIPSPLTDFASIVGTSFRNYLFFGVRESFITYTTYRNIGLWWEPGAYQFFVNLGFLFGIYHGKISIKTYCLFLLVILSTQSTAGIVVFSLLSLFYFRRTKFNFRLILIGGAIIFSYLLVFSEFYSVVVDKLNANSAVFYSPQSRIYDHVVDWNILKDHFFLGAGFGNFSIRDLYGVNILGQDVYYSLAKPTGADGIFLLISQLGILSCLLIVPLLFPGYMRGFPWLDRLLVAAVLFIIFNTENFSYYFIFSAMCLYGFEKQHFRMEKT